MTCSDASSRASASASETTVWASSNVKLRYVNETPDRCLRDCPSLCAHSTRNNLRRVCRSCAYRRMLALRTLAYRRARDDTTLAHLVGWQRRRFLERPGARVARVLPCTAPMANAAVDDCPLLARMRSQRLLAQRIRNRSTRFRRAASREIPGSHA